MTSDEIKSLATEASSFLAAIPALAPYTAPIALGMAVAAAVAPPIYDEIKSLFAKTTAGEPVSEEQIARLHELIAALQNPEDYFSEKPASLNFIR